MCLYRNISDVCQHAECQIVDTIRNLNPQVFKHQPVTPQVSSSSQERHLALD